MDDAMYSASNAFPNLTIRHMVFLFVLALLPRALLLGFGPWQDPERAMQPDSYRYLLLAQNLREHQTFGLLGPGGLMHQSIVRLRGRTGPCHRRIRMACARNHSGLQATRS